MRNEELTKIMNHLFQKAIDIREKKCNDYASDENVFANFDVSTVGGITREQALFSKLSDKFSRLGNFIKNKEMKVDDEKVEDTVVDLINYAVYIYASSLDKERRR